MPQSKNCARADGDCEKCYSYSEIDDECYQDDDNGCTGHGDESMSDADPGM